MLAEMAGVGVCQLVKCDGILVLLRQIDERLCEGELVGRRVTPEQDDASPIGLLGRSVRRYSSIALIPSAPFYTVR